MKKRRIIPRLDVKGPNVVKGICLEGLRVLGKPEVLAKKYYEQGADEILYIDIVASLYERQNLVDIVKKTVSSGVFIPVTVGGGIRTLEDIKNLLHAGADKVAINTAATRNPEFITKAAKMFGSQCIVGSIEAKYKEEEKKWEAYIDNGRECTGLDAIEWAKKLVELGVGELLVTSVDRDGTKKGYDKELIKRIVSQVSVPVIACGGANNEENIYSCLKETDCDAVAFASLLHYDYTTIGKVKEKLKSKEIPIRNMIKPNKNNFSCKKEVSIIDYDVGNIRSLVHAIESLGNKVKLINTRKEILDSELLILPGDGAFGYAIQDLKNKNLIEPIKKYVLSGKPLLGICLGMQLLMSESEEFGKHKGLDIIKGKVIKLKSKEQIEQKTTELYNVPHMGWNTLSKKKDIDWKGTILENVPEESETYFIHSYFLVPQNIKDIMSLTYYGEQQIPAVVKKGNVYAVQFHPEKSGQIGISILKSFCECKNGTN